MMIKTTIQGMLLYLVLCSLLLALLSCLAGRRQWGGRLFAVSFGLGVFAYAYRWLHVGHLPMQNMFEVFLTLTVLVYPLSRVCGRLFGGNRLELDLLLNIIVLFPAALVFSDEPKFLPPSLQCWLFGPHVAAYMVAYLLLFKAGCFAVMERWCHWRRQGNDVCSFWDGAVYQMILLGFPFLTLGLVLGSWWAWLAWADYWGWDPKELWSLASWLIYVLYFHTRRGIRQKGYGLNSFWAIIGCVVILITLLWVNFSNLFSGLHSYAS